MRFGILYRTSWAGPEETATAYSPDFGDGSIFAVGTDGRTRSFSYSTYGRWWVFAPVVALRDLYLVES